MKAQEILIGQLKQDIVRIKIDANVKVDNLLLTVKNLKNIIENSKAKEFS